jgi:hypothetical protein
MFTPATKATIKERFVAAYYAFRQEHRPDFKAFLDKHNELSKAHEAAEQAREERRKTAIDRLDGYDRSIITSIAGGTSNAERLFDQILPTIEKLDVDDQLVVMKHIFEGNPSAVNHSAMRGWGRNHLRDLLANLPE